MDDGTPLGHESASLLSQHHMLLADGLVVIESAEFATNFEWVHAVFLNGSEALTSRF